HFPTAALATPFGFLCFRIRRPARRPLFPYTTLFRSLGAHGVVRQRSRQLGRGERVELLEADEGHVLGVLLLAALQKVEVEQHAQDRKSTRLNSSHEWISYAVFCLKKKNQRKYTCRIN